MTSSLPPGQITRMTMPPMVRRNEAPQKDQAARSSQSVRTIQPMPAAGPSPQNEAPQKDQEARSSQSVRTIQPMPAAGPSNLRAPFMPRVVNSPVEQDTVIEAGMVNLANNQPRVEVPHGSKTDWGIIDALLPDIRRGFKQKDSEKTEPKADDESGRLLIAQTLLRKDKRIREEQLASMTWIDQYSFSTQEALRKAVGEFQHRNDAAERYWELYCKNQGFEDGSKFTVGKTFRYVAEYIAPLIRYNVGQGQKSSAAEVFYSPLEVLARQTTVTQTNSPPRSDFQHNSWISPASSSSNDVADITMDTSSKRGLSVAGSSGHSGGPVGKWSSPTGSGEPKLSDTALDLLLVSNNPSVSPVEVSGEVLPAGNSSMLHTDINSLLRLSKTSHPSAAVAWNQDTTMIQTAVEPINNAKKTQKAMVINQVPVVASRLNLPEERRLEDVLCPTQMIPPIPWFTGRRPVYNPPKQRLDPTLKTVKDVLWEYRVGFKLGAGIPRPEHIKVDPPRWPSIKDLCKNFEYQWVHSDDVALLKSRLAIVKMYLIFTESDKMTVMDAIQKLETIRGDDDLLPFGDMLAVAVKDRFLTGTADNLRYSELPYTPDEEPLERTANDFYYQRTPRPEEGPIWFSSYGAKGDFTELGPLRHPTMVYFPDLEITNVEKIWFEWHQKLTHLQGRDRSYWNLPGSSNRHYSEFCLRKRIVLSICEGLRIGSVAKVQYAFIELTAKQQSPDNKLVGFGDAEDFRTAVFVHKDADDNDIRLRIREATEESKAKKKEEAQADDKLTLSDRKQKQKNLRVRRLQYVKVLIQEDLKRRIAIAKEESMATEAERRRQQMVTMRGVVRQRQEALEVERRPVSDLKRKDKGVARGTRVKVESVDTRLVA